MKWSKGRKHRKNSKSGIVKERETVMVSQQNILLLTVDFYMKLQIKLLSILWCVTI